MLEVIRNYLLAMQETVTGMTVKQWGYIIIPAGLLGFLAGKAVKSAQTNPTTTTAKVLKVVAGAAVGAAVGAAIGSAILPVGGTVVGMVIGGIAGAIGSWFA